MTTVMSEMQKSALIEAGNIGSGHAAISLSQIIGKKIMIAIPSIDLIELTELNIRLDHKNLKYVQVGIPILGDISGTMIFLAEKERSKTLCEIIMGQPHGSCTELGEIEISALQEVGNILSSSYLAAINKMSGLSFIPSVPISFVDALSIQRIVKETGVPQTDQLFCIRTEFMQMEIKISAYLIFAPMANSIEKILEAIT